MVKQSSPAKDWVFTINNPQDVDWDMCWEFHYQYIVFQVEVGLNGTPHIQGFVQFADKVRRTACKKLHPTAHWEKRRGTPEEASHYCKKPVKDCKCKHCDGLERFDNEAFEDGYMSMDPMTELRTACSVLKEKGLSHVIERYPSLYVRNSQGMEKLATFYSPVRDFKTTTTVVWGQADAGKSRYASLGPSAYFLPASGGKGQTDFFGDYRPDQHRTVIADDFYGQWKYTTFLRVADRHPTEVHTKGGFRQFLAEHLVLTSNIPPHEWYKKVLAVPARKESFDKRITVIVKMVCGPLLPDGTTTAFYVVEKVSILSFKRRDSFRGRLLHG